jgi:hypothetical protein
MKKSAFIPAFAATLSLVAFVSCGEYGDVTKPVIVLNEPEEEEYFQLGGTLHLDIELSDNEALDEYKVEIHLAAGHTHTRATVAEAAEEEPASIFSDAWSDASGMSSKHVQRDIVLPAEGEEGDYHLMVYCTDKSGNENRVVRTIELGTEPASEPHEH